MARSRVFHGGMTLLLALLPVLAAAAGPVPPAVRTIEVDPETSRIGFEIRTRYGQRLQGRVDRFHGQVEELADGRQRFSVVLDMESAEIAGHPHYSRWMRGADFFDVASHPRALFQSEPHPASLAHQGGAVDGWLVLRQVRGPVRMVVDGATCAAPGYDCPVAGQGEVSRAVYGMDRWQLAVSDRVTFVLQVRLKGAVSR